MMFNNTLLDLARWKLRDQMIKSGFVPTGGGDPSAGGDPTGGMGGAMAGAGGAPPGDPSAGGMPPGDPSGGMPPTDPSAGAMPPTDPSAGAGGPDIAETIRSVVQQELQKANAGGGGMGGAAGGMGGGMGKPAKPDLNVVANDTFQTKKLLTYLMNVWQIPLPPDILDGPNRDPSTGQSVAPNTPGSTSDPSQQASPPPSAIQPIQPMQGAQPDPGAGTKQGSLVNVNMFDIGEESPGFAAISNRASSLAKLAKSLRERKQYAN